MYHASTVLTGSEMPALTSTGSCVAAGCQQTRTKARTAAQTRAPRAWVFVGIATPFAILFHAPPTAENSKLPEQPAESRDAVIDAAAPQRIPHDRLVRRHDVDGELALERVDCLRRRPMRRRQQDRVGVRVVAHELAPHVECGVARNASDLVEGAAPAGRAQHLAAEMSAIARDPIGLAQLVGLRHHHLLATELKVKVSTSAAAQARAAKALACAAALVETLTFSSASRSLI